MSDTILVLGSSGQVGTDLVSKLREIHGESNVIASDIRQPAGGNDQGPFVPLDVLNTQQIKEVFTRHKPTVVYHLAAMLSATAEKNPKAGWNLNMEGLFHIFDACLEYQVKRVFWPSSIAVFGPSTPRESTPQLCVMDPNTVYGISKLAGERYCEYYFNRYGLDVRSIRYPGLIGWKALPGGGTTDYAVDIFHQAIQQGSYTCFLKEDTRLPMMYMDDAIKATIDVTDAPADLVQIRSSYNVAGFSFDPAELANEIRSHIPGFTMDYNIDHRQKIAESWPSSIDDSHARADWNWHPDFSVASMVNEMIQNLQHLAVS